MKKWTKEEIEYVIDNFKTMNFKDISKKIQHSEGSIRAKCFELGLVKNLRWTDEEINFIKENAHKMTYAEMSRYLNRTTTSINIKLKKMGIKKSEYFCDYHFFENIDTEEKAYWLGFLYADGWIYINEKTNSGDVGIQLKIEDYGHLIKFNESINGNYKIDTGSKMNFGKTYEFCRIRIYSIDMVNDLINKNLLINKTYKKEFPIVEESLMKHFIRGFFDGDGCVRWKKTKKKYYGACDFTSLNIDFLNFIRKYIYEKINVNSYILQEKSGCYRLCIHSNENSIKFLKYIYDDSCVHLDRKYILYKEITNTDHGICLAS